MSRLLCYILYFVRAYCVRTADVVTAAPRTAPLGLLTASQPPMLHRIVIITLLYVYSNLIQ